MLLFVTMLTLGVWVRKAVECFKHFLMGHNTGSMEDNGVDNDLVYVELAQEISENNFSILPRNSSYDTLIKNNYCPFSLF